MSLLILPPEIVLDIATKLPPPDLNNLIKANKCLAILLRNELHTSVVVHNSEVFAQRALKFAGVHRNTEIVRRLLFKGVMGVVGPCILELGVSGESAEVVQTWIAGGMSTTPRSQRDYGVLLMAVRDGNTDMVRMLKDCDGVDVNRFVQGWAPITAAVRKASPAIVGLLSGDPRVNVNVENREHDTALHMAVRGRRREDDPVMDEILRTLLQNPRVDINHMGDPSYRQSVLHVGAYYSSARLRILLEDGRFDVNVTDFSGMTPLHFAASEGRAEAVGMLLEVPGVQVNTLCEEQRTALISAVEYGHFDVVKLLVRDRRVDCNKTDRRDYSAVNIAAKNGDVGILELLLQVPGIDLANSDADYARGYSMNVIEVLEEYRVFMRDRVVDSNLNTGGEAR